MSCNLYVIAAILFICRPCFAQAPTSEVQAPSIANTNTNSSVKLEDSTPVSLRTKQDLSSAKAKVGDRVPFGVAKDVTVADLIVIPRGADAWGLVTAVQHKRRQGRPGNLDVVIQSVRLLTGENAPLRAEQHSQGESRDALTTAEIPKAALNSIATFGVTLPMALLTMLEEGKDAHLPVGTRFTAYLNGDVVLDRIALERVQPASVHRTGPANVTIFAAATEMGAHRSIYCGKVALAKLSRFAYLKIQLPPGKYYFHSDDEQVVEVKLEEGQELYLQMLQVFLKHGIKGHLVLIDNEDGEERTAHLRQLPDKDVTKVSDANIADLKATPEVK